MARSSVGQTNQRSGGASYYSYVKQEFRKGYEIPLLPYQTSGILTRPLWNTKNHVIRIIPGYDPETGEIFRQNTRVNEYVTDGSYLDYLSDTVMQSSTLQMFGEQKQTLLSDYAPDSEDARRWGGDTALHVFIRNVLNAVQGKRRSRFGVTSDMARWADPKQGVLRFPKNSLLMQALIFTANDRENTDRNGTPLVDDNGNTLPLLAVVSVDGKQTVQALLAALVEPSNPGEPLDAITNNKFGGMAEADGNKLFLNHATDSQTGYNYLRPSVQLASKGWEPTPFPLSEEAIKQLWHPWEDLLQFLTVDEQLHLLASEFGADSVNYLVGTDPMYVNYKMPDDIARAGYGRYTKFTNGVKDVTQSIHVNEAAPQPRAASPAPFGMPKKAQAPAAPVAQRDPLSGVQNANTVDTDKLRAEVAKIRAATQKKPLPTPDKQAADAASLLESAEVEYEPENIGL